MPIRLLPAKVINRIAAGEVVERPASVVKELVENSVDANATEVNIFIAQGGRNLIKVIDNGCGIAKEEMRLAVARHATSKLSDNNLFNITYMGFRGEALSSISSVSRMKIASRARESDLGWSIEVEGGELSKDLTPDSIKYGTKIEICDLFFATPVRLKFLKTEKAETQHIIDIVTKIAMTNPQIRFSLTVNDRKLFDYLIVDSKKERLLTIKGKEFEENVVEVLEKKGDLEITGYVGLPTYNRVNANYLYLFVNNRPVRDNLLISAVKAAYKDFIPYGRYPVVILYLTVPQQVIDVNVHPTKAEVRFQDKNLVRNFVVTTLKLAIKKSMYRATSETTNLALNYFNSNKNLASNIVMDPIIKKKSFDIHNVSSSKEVLKEKVDIANLRTTKKVSKTVLVPVAEKQVLLDQLGSISPLGFARCQLYLTYILSESDDCIFLVDQHAAHERLVYEYLKNTVKIERQVLLAPEVVELNEAEVELFLEYKEYLQKVGMYAEKMGENAILVRELPAIIGQCDIKRLVLDIVDNIKSFGIALSLEKKIESVYLTFACHTSIRAGRKLNTSEMNAILRQMELNSHTGQCNHGRPTYVTLKKNDIEKLFERR